MQPTPVSPNAIRFGLFEADLSAGELRKRGRKIPLQDQPFRVLTLLLRRPGELVTREEFQRVLWPADTFVEFDEGLNKAIQKLRQALDDSAENPRFIETLPRKGYRFIAPMESLNDKASSTTLPAQDRDNGVSTPSGGPVKRRKMKILAWTLFGVVTLALFVLAGVHFRLLPQTVQPVSRAVPLTSYPGRQVGPALSPDGKQVAFAWEGEKGNNFDIYVKLVDAGAALRLTSNPAAEYAPTWSPDGRYIAFCREASGHAEIWMIAALGGAERRLGDSAWCGGLSWSPNGKLLALTDQNAQQSRTNIFLLSIETGDKRKLTSPPNGFADHVPDFSPDGNTLAFVRSPNAESGEIYELPVTADGRPGGEPRRLTFDEQKIGGFDWSADGRRIIYSSGVLWGQLWTIPVSGGKPERLSVASENASAISISHSGSRLVYERQVVDSSIWRVPGPSLPPLKAPVQLIASKRPESEPQFAPNGDRIAFVSARSGNMELWVCESEGRNPVQLTSLNGPPAGSPRWSPDGRWIAFDVPQAGNWDVFVINADGGLPRRLTTGPTNNVRPSWSRDGHWIYFGSNRSGDWQIWKMPAQGGAAVQVRNTEGGLEAFESLDSKFVYYAKRKTPGIWRVPTDGGQATQVLEQGEESHWALTNQGICFFDLRNGAGPALRFFSFAAHKASLLRRFSKETRIDYGDPALSVTADGRWILYTQLDQFSSDLMLVENFR